MTTAHFLNTRHFGFLTGAINGLAGTRVARTLSLTLALATSPISAIVSADVVLDEIAAVVNDGVVLQSDIRQESEFILLRNRAAQQPPPPRAELRKQVLDQLIDREVQRQRAAALGIEVDQGSINSAIEKVAAGNNMNSFEFRQSLQQEGFDYAYYRKGIAHELLIARLVRREVRDSINVTEKEIDDYLASQNLGPAQTQQYNIKHIVIAMPSSSSAANIASARLKAVQSVEKLRAGADFRSMAMDISDGPRASDGGGLGWREAAELPDFIADVVPTLSRGEISDPIQSKNGFHIIKLDRIRSAEEAELSEEVRMRHIFIDTESDTDDSAARNTLTALRERIVAGESFAVLAKEFSQDPDTSSNGGELPWLAGGQMPVAMDNATSQLATGQISPPFRTQFGWHIVEILERRQGSSANSRARNDASQLLRQKKFAQEVDRWQRTLREESFVEILK